MFYVIESKSFLVVYLAIDAILYLSFHGITYFMNEYSKLIARANFDAHDE